MKGHSEATLIHDTSSPCELWHRMLDHIKYKALPHVSNVVTGLPDLNIDHQRLWKGCNL